MFRNGEFFGTVLTVVQKENILCRQFLLLILTSRRDKQFSWQRYIFLDNTTSRTVSLFGNLANLRSAHRQKQKNEQQQRFTPLNFLLNVFAQM